MPTIGSDGKIRRPGRHGVKTLHHGGDRSTYRWCEGMEHDLHGRLKAIVHKDKESVPAIGHDEPAPLDGKAGRRDLHLTPLQDSQLLLGGGGGYTRRAPVDKLPHPQRLVRGKENGRP